MTADLLPTTSPSLPFIGFSGRIGSGKDTLALMCRYLVLNQHHPGLYNSFDEFALSPNTGFGPWQIRRWADKLKQIASLLTGIPAERFEDQEFKQSYLGEEWTRYAVYRVTPQRKKPVREVVFATRRQAEQHLKEKIGGRGYVESEPLRVRELLQRLGTEGVRDTLHPDAWVNALMQSHASGQTWLIPDTRFPNEAAAITSRGGILVRVERPTGVIVPSSHPSETLLDGFLFDHVIYNNGSLADLLEKARALLSNYGLLSVARPMMQVV
jgi:hypothetical protein